MSDIFFGIQVAVQSPPGDSWRERLCSLVRRHQRDLRVDDKRGLYGAVINLLQQMPGRLSLGFWDFIPDGKNDFDEWASGLEDDAQETWAPDRGAVMDHVLVTMIFLLPEDGSSAELVGQRCDLPETDWMTLATFQRLFETVGMLRFASVRQDGLYVTPGGLDVAFSLRELQTEGYDYLLPIA